MYCRKCGNLLKDGQQFCPMCGTKPASMEAPAKKHCSQCGNELEDSQQFCPACGTKWGNFARPAGGNMSTGSAAFHTADMKSNFTTGLAALGQNKILFFVNAALVILSLIFAATETFEASSLGISKGASMLSEDEGFQLFFVVAYIASVVCMMLPLLLAKRWSMGFFVPAQITTMLATLWFAIGWMSGKVTILFIK